MANTPKATKRKRAKKPTLSAAEKAQRRAQRQQRNASRYVFDTSGFVRATPDIEIHFTYQGVKSEFDDIFIQENVVVLCEYTISGESKIGDHLRKKKILYDLINSDHAAFIDFLKATFPKAAEALRGSFYRREHYQVRIVYCSLNPVSPSLKAVVPGVIFFDHHKLVYFKHIASTVRLSARGEFLTFLSVESDKFGVRVMKPRTGEGAEYEGSLLPEAHSGFPDGYKVVSFYADAAMLLSHCYVLRKDGWRDGSLLYQRMISKQKIESMRRHLTGEGRVYVNNIVATLPTDTEIRSQDNKPIDPKALKETTTVTLRVPARYNCVGLIDGQHRVLSYYEGGKIEKQIAPLRELQNLLVTGIVYPDGISDEEKVRFEARLFHEINSNQATANPEIRQAIALLLNPWDLGSIAREVVNRLNETSGIVGNEFERFFFDKDKLKVASIASFGVKPLVKLSGTDSAFALWSEARKEELKAQKDLDLRSEYVIYAASLINIILGAMRQNVPAILWTRDRKVSGRLLTTTTINGAIALLRILIDKGVEIEQASLATKMGGLSSFPISSYKSSQYNRLGKDLYEACFAPSATAAPSSEVRI